MKKSVILKIDGNKECIIGYDEKTMVTFQIGYNPYYEKGDGREYSYDCHGFEWGDECYSIIFCGKEIKEGQKLELEFGVSENSNIKPTKELVTDEKRCSFCNKLSTEVETLIDNNIMSRICNECVQECVKVINEKNA